MAKRLSESEIKAKQDKAKPNVIAKAVEGLAKKVGLYDPDEAMKRQAAYSESRKKSLKGK